MDTKKTILKITLGILIFIVLLIPIFLILANDKKEKEYNELIDSIELAAEKWAKGYMTESNTGKVKLGDLKKINFIDNILYNSKTNSYLSNETYIEIKKSNGTYTTNVVIYDIPKKEQSVGLILNVIGEKRNKVTISSYYVESGITAFEGDKEIEYSTQYFYKGKEIDRIDTSRPKNFEVVYTTLNSKGEIAKIVRSIVVQ